MIFNDRKEAGQKLAERLKEFALRPDVVLFALPRGGVVVGAEIAKAWGVHLHLIVTRKIGAPENEEYALGALAETGEVVWNEVERSARDAGLISSIVQRETEEAQRRIKKYRNGRPLPDLSGKISLIVDDGVATGLTIKAAIAAARHQNAKRVIIAVPHGASDSLKELSAFADEVIALERPLMYGAVGAYYNHFEQTTDEEVIALMKKYGSQV